MALLSSTAWATGEGNAYGLAQVECVLFDVGIGMRDAGELLGISHQRVQQLVKR